MPVLICWRGGKRHELRFESGITLWEALDNASLAPARPCGGRGVCGKCAALLSGGVSEPNEAEKRAGARLACQAVLLGDAEARLPDEYELDQIELGGEAPIKAASPMSGELGAAIDIGTTTIALRLYELSSGECLARAAMRSPQSRVAADVMGRISAALSGGLCGLKAQAEGALKSLLERACAEAGRDIRGVHAMVITGNTTMLYLLTGRSPESLSRAPFAPDCLFDETVSLFGAEAYLPPCAGAFVGADAVCAALSTGLCESPAASLLCDIGTNGEIMLLADGKLHAASVAAGPALEGAGISCGTGSVLGAIDRVWAEGGRVGCRTIGGAPPTGICGSGLIDAVAAYLQLGEIDETGAISQGRLPLAGGLYLIQSDIRALQLAKAAISAGVLALTERAGVSPEGIERMCVAGGFGRHIDMRSASSIGLLPRALALRAIPVGNAALDGAALMLLDASRIPEARAIAKRARIAPLGGDARFEELFLANMGFGACG